MPYNRGERSHEEQSIPEASPPPVGGGFHCGRDRARHFDLRSAWAIAVDLAGEQTIGGEELLELGHAARAQYRRRSSLRSARVGLRRAAIARGPGTGNGR